MNKQGKYKISLNKKTKHRLKEDLLRIYKKQNVSKDGSIQGTASQANKLFRDIMIFAERIENMETGDIIKDRSGNPCRSFNMSHMPSFTWARGSGKSLLSYQIAGRKMRSLNKEEFNKEYMSNWEDKEK